MSSLMRSGGAIKRRKPLPRRGPKAEAWKKFRDAEFQKDCDEEGLIRCQDRKIGLPHCGVASSFMDLHHVEGRNGKLMFDKSKMVWLTRECHDTAHNNR